MVIVQLDLSLNFILWNWTSLNIDGNSLTYFKTALSYQT